MITNKLTGIISLTAVLVLGTSSVTLAQPGPGGPGGFGGGPRGGAMRMGGPRDALSATIQVLGDLNLSPEFTLSSEQKQRIQTIRDAFRQQQDKWRTDHEEELKKLEEQMADLRDAGGPPDPDQMQEMEEARRALFSTAPDGEEESGQVKAVLTAEQSKQFEAREQQMQRNRPRMRDGGAGGAPRR